MSNGRIAAIAFNAGLLVAIALNAVDDGGPLLNIVRQMAGGVIFAAVAVAMFGDRK